MSVKIKLTSQNDKTSLQKSYVSLARTFQLAIVCLTDHGIRKDFRRKDVMLYKTSLRNVRKAYVAVLYSIIALKMLITKLIFTPQVI